MQYSLSEGPCVSAVADRRTFTSGNLGGEALWPRFGPRVGRLGVHSALSLPLLLPGRVIGALNVYAHGRDVFGPHAVGLGEAFAPHAAASVYNAQLLAQAERLVTQLQAALVSRSEIDQALGRGDEPQWRRRRRGVRQAPEAEPVPVGETQRGGARPTRPGSTPGPRQPQPRRATHPLTPQRPAHRAVRRHNRRRSALGCAGGQAATRPTSAPARGRHAQVRPRSRGAKHCTTRPSHRAGW